MIEIFTIGCHIGITLLAVAAIAVRIEHRLTKIETDLTWLKNNQKCENNGKGKKHESYKDVV